MWRINKQSFYSILSLLYYINNIVTSLFAYHILKVCLSLSLFTTESLFKHYLGHICICSLGYLDEDFSSH